MNIRGNRGFTLIELIGVITIMAVMMIIGISSYQGIGKAAKLDQALIKLKTTLSLARQHAILNHTDVSVYLPFFSVSVDGGLRSYAAYAGTNRLTEWMLLPQGVYFDDNTTLGNNIFGKTVNISLEDYDNGALTTFAYCRFKSDGSIGGIMQTKFYVREGILDSGGTFVDTGNLSSSATNAVQIYPLTGVSVILKDDERI